MKEGLTHAWFRNNFSLYVHWSEGLISSINNYIQSRLILHSDWQFWLHLLAICYSPLSIFSYFFITFCFLHPFQMFLHPLWLFHSPLVFEILFLRWWSLSLPHLFPIYYPKVIWNDSLCKENYARLLYCPLDKQINIFTCLFLMRRSTVPYSDIEYSFFFFLILVQKYLWNSELLSSDWR